MTVRRNQMRNQTYLGDSSATTNQSLNLPECDTLGENVTRRLLDCSYLKTIKENFRLSIITSHICGMSEEAASTKQAQRSATDLIRTMIFCPVVLKSYSSSKPLAGRQRLWPLRAYLKSIIPHRNHEKLHLTENNSSTLKIAELSSSSQLFSKQVVSDNVNAF